MTSENRAKISVSVDLSTFKLALETEVTHDALDAFLTGLMDTIEKSAKKIEKTFGSLKVATEQAGTPSSSTKPYPLGGISDPLVSVARRLGVDAQKLVGNNLFGFKEDRPQLFDPTKFKSAGAAARVLLFLYEVGLERSEVQYEEFQKAFDLSKIKGRKLSQVVADWTKGAVIDSSRYKSGEELILSAKGAADAISELRGALGLGPP